MKLKLTLTFLFTAILSLTFSQNISVQSFRLLENDLDARVNSPKSDQNGEKCAIIKIVTTEQGFVWEGDALGITETKSKTSEYWLYIPRGAKRLTIKQAKLGMLRDYVYPLPIKEATVYEMVLTTAKISTIIEEQIIPMQYVIITSEPHSADIYIDDLLVGNTGNNDSPFQKSLKVGKHTYRIEKAFYHPQAGVFDLTEENIKHLNVELKPNFGYVFINTKPEQEVSVEIDGKPAGKTPLKSDKLSPGKHRATLKKVMFKDKTVEFEIFEGDQSNLDIDLEPTFALINITTEPNADIYINDKREGNGNYTGRILPGIYTIEAKKDNYFGDKKQKEFIAGETANLSLHVRARTGILDIKTEPFNATIKMDDADYGKTPKIIKDLLIGEHNILIEKEGYLYITKKITIKENEILSLDVKLEKKPLMGALSIKTEPINARIKIDGNDKGETPKTIKDLLIGEHLVVLEKEGYKTLTKKTIIKENETVTLDEILEKDRKVDYSYNDYSINKPATTGVKQNYNGGPGNMFLSVLIPGLGDKRVSGNSGGKRTLTVYGLIAGGIACKYISDIEYQNYHDATLQSDMDKYYESANTYNKLFYILTASGVVVWIYDIIWVADKGFKNKRNQRSYSTHFDLNYDPKINGLAFSLNISF